MCTLTPIPAGAFVPAGTVVGVQVTASKHSGCNWQARGRVLPGTYTNLRPGQFVTLHSPGGALWFESLDHNARFYAFELDGEYIPPSGLTAQSPWRSEAISLVGIASTTIEGTASNSVHAPGAASLLSVETSSDGQSWRPALSSFPGGDLIIPFRNFKEQVYPVGLSRYIRLVHTPREVIAHGTQWEIRVTQRTRHGSRNTTSPSIELF